MFAIFKPHLAVVNFIHVGNKYGSATTNLSEYQLITDSNNVHGRNALSIQFTTVKILGKGAVGKSLKILSSGVHTGLPSFCLLGEGVPKLVRLDVTDDHVHLVTPLLCAGRVPVEPVLTTTAACGTAVESSLGSAGLPQWSQTQAYASNIYLLSPVSSSSS